LILVAAALCCASSSLAAERPDLIARHPAADTLRRLFPDTPAAVPPHFKPTGLTRADYLKLIAGNADFFVRHQDASGAIIDPYERKERQYSTPAFALAAALLVKEARREDLLSPASRALTFSIDAMLSQTTADNHADFYIPLVVHARRILEPLVAKEVAQHWTRQLTAIIPERTYREVQARNNWNIVNVAGECLRRKDGLVPDRQLAAHAEYIERSLSRQRRHFTAFGLFEDPNAPLAYDAFPRLWLEDVVAESAYDGPQRQELEQLLGAGGLSTLLMLSPAGEWPCGGRSAHHQWNEAQVAAICEISARRWKRARPDVAGSFKRAARLALSSMQRWQRPSGELWIVKNRFDPAARHGYEGYSFHSQYNLLAMAMLALACIHADDSIAERPLPSESAVYVMDLREHFHKVIAAAGGYYVLIDTAADPHYNATGLQRVHRGDVAFSPLSDSAAGQRTYHGGRGHAVKLALTPGICWKETADGPWFSLADFDHPAKVKNESEGVVRSAELAVESNAGAEAAAFSLTYTLAGAGGRAVRETYQLSADGVTVRSELVGGGAPASTRVVFPVLVSDGAADTQRIVDRGRLQVRHRDGELTCGFVPGALDLIVDGPAAPTHNGLVRAATGTLPAGATEVRYHVQLKAPPK
jgi:hypothetical protein